MELPADRLRLMLLWARVAANPCARAGTASALFASGAGVIVAAGLVAQRFMFTARAGGATVFCTRVVVVAIDGGLNARAVLAVSLLGAGRLLCARQSILHGLGAALSALRVAGGLLAGR